MRQEVTGGKKRGKKLGLSQPPTRPAVIVSLAIVCVLSVACGLPRDPEGTLERVMGGKMRVGVSERDPWVVLGGSRPAGVEVEIVESLARRLDADVEWVQGSIEELASAAHVGELDLIIAGLTSQTTISSQVALTHPYLTTQLVIAVPRRKAAEEDLAGVQVAVEDATQAAGILEKTDAVPVRVNDVANARGPVAVESYRVDDLGLKDTGIRLSESDHVMGVPHGENAWLVRLERFLLDHTSEIEEILERKDVS